MADRANVKSVYMAYPDKTVNAARLFYTDTYELPLPPGHRFPIEKYRILREMLEADGDFSLHPAPLADVATIERIHDPEYVHAFVAGTLGDAAMRRIGFPWSEGLVKRTLASVGSTLAQPPEKRSIADGEEHWRAGPITPSAPRAQDSASSTTLP